MKRILIIRPTAMGDIVMASPMIEVLRRAYPEGHLAWLADPGLAVLLRNHPGLDEVIPWSKGEWEKLLRGGRWLALAGEVRRLARELRRRRFDLALDVQGLARSRFLAWLSGARERIGFESKEPGGFLLTRLVSRGPDSDRMSSEYRYMMEILGLEPGAFAPHLAVAESDRQSASALLREAGVVGEYAVLAPFTTRPQKHWFADRWAELAQRIERELGLTPVILGGPGDVAAGEAIAQAAGGAPRSLAGGAPLAVSVAVVAGAGLVVGVDTGLTHMGSAFARPTIALFGATCPYRETASPATRVLYHYLPCSPCKRSPTCDGRYDCMVALTVDDVARAASELVSRSEETR
jgi:heptosyltransferase-1